MLKTVASQLIQKVASDSLRVINQPDIIWLFGSGAEEILSINAPQTNSKRAGFYRWLMENCRNHSNFKTPEHYPDWISIHNGYTNLIDLELDLIAISKATIIFSESEGAFAELGVLACQNQDQLQNVMVVVDDKYLNVLDNGVKKRTTSFINLGPLEKIRQAYHDEDDAPIFGFENGDNSVQYKEIKSRVEAMTASYSSKSFDSSSRKHKLLLLIDIIHLLNKSTKKDICSVLKHFGVVLKPDEIKGMLNFLILIEIVEKVSGNNTYYQLYKANYHKPLIDYKGIKKPFDRGAFLLEMGK